LLLLYWLLINIDNHRYGEQLFESKNEIEKLKKEKKLLSEKSFEETRKLSESLYEKENLLQQALQSVCL
jgi:hypothetical protein